MSTATTTQLSHDQLHPASHFGGHPSHCYFQTYTNMTATLTCQPPTKASAGSSLYPPIVAELHGQQGEDIHMFATAVLVDSHGVVQDGLMQGTTAATGVASSSSDSTLFAFTDLSITQQGMYTVRLDIYRVSSTDANGATLVAQVDSTSVTVQAAQVPTQQPCKTTPPSVMLSSHSAFRIYLQTANMYFSL